MTTNRLKNIWSQVPPDYYEKGIAKNFFQKLWHTRKWMIIKKMIDFNPQNVLDVGCASGWLAARIAKILPQASVTGVDVSPKMIDYAKVVHPDINFVQADAQKLPFPKESFDLIVCTETLEHVVDPSKVLNEIKRCLADDGIVVISMDSGSPLFKFIWFFWLKTKGRVWRYAHLHQFNRSELKKLLRKTGFKIEEQKVSHLGMEITFKLKKRI